MHELDDLALLRAYATRGSERAFTELVSRRIGFVHSAALRQVRDPHLAGEITQAVFIILAKKAGKITGQTILTGWLFQTTRYVALAQIRAVTTLQRRELEAHMQAELSREPNSPTPDPLWEKMSPLLDQALTTLGETDRHAVLLRFFENKSLAEVGRTLGTGEDTARKRVSRALDKLHRFFDRRGVSLTMAIIAGTLTVNSVHAAPATLAKSVTAASLVKGAVASSTTLTLTKGALKIMAWTKIKTAIAGSVMAILVLGATATIVKKTVLADEHNSYETLFKHPDSSILSNLEKMPPVLILRPTLYPNTGGGIWTMSGKGIFVGASLKDVLAWAYDSDPLRIILPPNAPKGDFDYLNTMAKPNDALRAEIKKQFGLVARREVRPADVIILQTKDTGTLNSFRTKGGAYACYASGTGDTQSRYFTNCPITMLAVQDVQAYFEKPCINRADTKGKYDFALQWKEPRGLRGKARRMALQSVIEGKINQLGLQLVLDNEPIEMLIVEKAQ